MGTQFSEVYNVFLNKITDDLYIELTPQDTLRDLQNLLIQAIPGFEFPRQNLYEYTLKDEWVKKELYVDGDFVVEENDTSYRIDRSNFKAELTSEEINILAILMKQGWLQRQLTSIENTRMKYSGSDFKFTSQANHLQKLITLMDECRRDSTHMQRLYKRRKTDDDGKYKSTWRILN